MSNLQVVDFKKITDEQTSKNHQDVIHMLERMLNEAKDDPTYTVFAIISTGNQYSYDIAGNETVPTMLGLTQISVQKIINHKVSLE